MTSTPDQTLLDSRDLAREALAEITDPQTVGSDDGYEVHEAHVLTLYFECRLPGYPGWRWATTLSRVDEDSPVNVLEAELLPGAGAVVAPEWVPWSVRLAQYRDAQAKQAEEERAASAAAADSVADGGEPSAKSQAPSDEDDEAEGAEDAANIDDAEILDDAEDLGDEGGFGHESDEDYGEDDDDDDDDVDDEDLEVDEDGFADIDEHDLHDHDDDDLDDDEPDDDEPDDDEPDDEIDEDEDDLDD